ncbi:MAG: rod shape-determining protein MreC [Planctomycetales bacterium]
MKGVARGGNLIAAVVCGVVAVGLAFAPASLRDPLRGTVRDAALPGERLVAGLVDRAAPVVVRWRTRLLMSGEITITANDGAANEIAATAEASQRRVRALEAEVARLREELDRRRTEEGASFPARPGAPLVVPDLFSATVLGEEAAALWRAGKLLDRGAADGVSESSLVLESEGPLVDQGTDAGLAAGQPVLAGRAVLGRIARVGRWTSALQLVTDPQYRGLARIVRRGERGVAFGPQGILEGDGSQLCRLRFVDTTAAVAVGDEVYTDDLEGLLPAPAYYGRIVEAESKPGAAHWEIRIEPAGPALDPREVSILRRIANPARFAQSRPSRETRAAAAN